jgi:hypothetical protein
LEEIRKEHIIPVFIKDNEPVISQVNFIQVTQEVVGEVFRAEKIPAPSIRLSHPIKGRVPEARNKPASELMEWEKTIYYERMAFLIEIPSIRDTIDGQSLSLTIGGIKAHNLDNLYNKKGAEEHFKIFIGFKVTVCCNLCIWTDGYAGEVKVKSPAELRSTIHFLIQSFDAISSLARMSELEKYSLTEQQFALLLGRCRLYQHLPNNVKKGIPELKFNDTQLGVVVRDYYRDNSFCRNESGEINLWRLYNLFTSANKSSYIDTFPDKALNATSFIQELQGALEGKSQSWFLS